MVPNSAPKTPNLENIHSRHWLGRKVAFSVGLLKINLLQSLINPYLSRYVLIPWGCHNKIGILKQGIYSHSSESQKMSIKVPVPSWRHRRRHFSCLSPSGCQQSLLFTGLWQHHFNLYFHLHMALAPHVPASKFPSCMRTPVSGLEPILIIYDLHSNLLHFQRNFQMKSQSQVSGICKF